MLIVRLTKLLRGPHSMQASYQKLLKNTIKTVLDNTQSDVQTVLVTVFERLMKAEREVF